MKILTRAALVAAFFIATPALAQTADEIKACTPDVFRHCERATHDLFPKLSVLACMLDHLPQLSTKCRAVFKAHGY